MTVSIMKHLDDAFLFYFLTKMILLRKFPIRIKMKITYYNSVVKIQLITITNIFLSYSKEGIQSMGCLEFLH